MYKYYWTFFLWSFFAYEAKIRKESKDEEENFLHEISRFNSDFSLRGNRETVFESQTHSEILDLEREMESLYRGRKTIYSNVVTVARG